MANSMLGWMPAALRARTALTHRLGNALAAVLAALALLGASVHAAEAVPASADPVLEARVMRVSAELRCLVCQNQTIADSHADLANDLRRQVREMLQAGQSEAQIIAYMTERYGDFVLYRPPFKATTVLLWVGPGVMVVLGLGTLFWVLRRRSRMAADQFEPDEEPDTLDTPDAPQNRHLS